MTADAERGLTADPADRPARSWAGWIAAGLLLLAAVPAIGNEYVYGFALDLGGLTVPRPRYSVFLLTYLLLGGAGVVALAIGCSGLVMRPACLRLSRWLFEDSSDRLWLLVGGLAAFGIAASLRLFLLEGTPLFDDEAAYRFQAKLLASGRLFADSHELKLFFDAPLMVNDGKHYAIYPVGWPAILALFSLVGLGGFANAALFGLTAPAIFLVARRVAGASWAKVAMLLFALAPMLAIAAATDLSYTASMACLAWLAWATTGSTPGATGPHRHAVVALLFSAAMFVRPFSAVALGTPLLVLWLVRVWSKGAGRWTSAAAFLLPAVLGAALFLGANQAQTGSAWKLGYVRGAEYVVENGGRFDTAATDDATFANVLTLDSVSHPLAHVGISVVRLNVALLGWPMSLLFLAFAVGARGTRPYWTSLGVFAALYGFTHDAGTDTFGPVHCLEAAVPILALTAAGMAQATSWASRLPNPRGWNPKGLVPALVIASLVACAFVYCPPRFAAIQRIVDGVRQSTDLVERAGVSNVVVFSSWPISPRCSTAPTKHFKHFHPLSDPDLSDDVLWANHLTVEDDRRLMAWFPQRLGLVLYWDDECVVHLEPLDSPTSGAIPPGLIGGSNVGLEPG